MFRKPRLIAGVMSGTSADGVDVAICQLHATDHPEWGRLHSHSSHPYPAALKKHIHALRRDGNTTLADLAALTRDITIEHAHAVRLAAEDANLPLRQLDAIADHGQTLFHAPPLTSQVLDPSLLAWELGVAVVSDFRRADLAAGGQGAPLVPFADRRLFSHPGRTRALLNLGGIANVTVLPPGAGPLTPVHAFDIGPANCLSDHLARSHHPDGPGFDSGGAVAARGSADERMVAAFLSYPFFRAPAPKSTDGPEMVDAFIAVGAMKLSYENALATAAACTARAVFNAIELLEVDEVILSGGGLHNLAVIRELSRLLGEIPLRTTTELGVPSEAKEALAFALLGNATLDNMPSNVPSATGATSAVVLGSVTPRPLAVHATPNGATGLP